MSNRIVSASAKCAVAAFGIAFAVAGHAQTNVFVNELHYDNAGGDTGEAIEIAAPAGTDLAGWSVELYNGNGGVSYGTINLTGIVPDQCGGFGTLFFPGAGIQNGSPDGLALVDATGAVVQLLSYEGAFAATDGPAAGATSIDIGVSEPSNTPVGFSLALTGTGSTSGDFSWAQPAAQSFGDCNAGQTFESGGSTAPRVTSVEPSNGASDVAIDAEVVVAFNEPVTVAADAISLLCDGSVVAAGFSATETAFTIDPADDLPNGASCTLTVPMTAVEDDDGNTLAADFSSQFDTVVDAGQCGDPAMLISEVQGSGDASPMEEEAVTVEGVVVGDFTGSSRLRGFFLQEEDDDGDGNPATSEGIFVFYVPGASDPEVVVGDAVRVTGEVDEFFGLTELTNVSVQACGAGAQVTAATLSLPLPGAGFPERLEGMLVDLGDGLTVTENFNQASFGEVLASSGRLFNPTQIAAPGPDQAVEADRNDRDQIIIDDGSSDRNPEPVLSPDGTELTAGRTTRAGTVVTGTAVMHFAFGDYRLQPVDLALVDENPRPATPVLPGRGLLKVASFNVLNYFTTIDEPDTVCGPDPENNPLGCRGADSEDEFERQQAKIVAALKVLDADIVGLVEVENNTIALQNLVDALNGPAGGPYAAFDAGPGPVGDDAIKVGLIYKTSTVEPTPGAVAAILDDSVLPSLGLESLAPLFDGEATNRAALAATFTEKASGESLTVVVNHFKSKGASGLNDDESDCVVIGPEADPNCDQDDGQGYWNARRTQAAQVLAAWLDTDPTSSRDFDVLILGDLNAYAKEDPIEALKSEGYSDLVNERVGGEAYSFVFFGEYGTLDYAMANAGAKLQTTGVDEWHINSDEPRAIDYNEESKSDAQLLSLYAPDPFRASDHDPLIVEMRLESAADALERLAREIAHAPLDLFAGRNARVRSILRKLLYKRARVAALFAEYGLPRLADYALGRVIGRIDGERRPRDWMMPSAAATALLESASTTRERLRFERF